MKAIRSRPAVGVRQADGEVRDVRTGAAMTVPSPVRGVGKVAPSETVRLGGALAAIRDAATPAWQCGDAIPVAPARGQVRRNTPSELVPDGQGGMRRVDTGYRGRDGAHVRDVFDKMVDKARNAHKAKVKKASVSKVSAKKVGVFEPPFTWGQVQAARDYAALTERCDAAGVKCSSLESLARSGSGGGREEAVFDDLARLRSLHRRIGSGLAKRLRRYKPSTSSAGPDRRKAITARWLVDQVCLSGRTPTEILQDAGWTGDGKQIKDLRAALSSALDRMQGFKPDEPQNMA